MRAPILAKYSLENFVFSFGDYFHFEGLEQLKLLQSRVSAIKLLV